MDPFVHLHVASGYSLRYGASHPHVLVERAAEQEMDTLALTDRDGTYGAVKFARACHAAGHPAGARRRAGGLPGARARPCSRPSGARPRTPVRGGAFRDRPGAAPGDRPGHAGAAGGRAGWAAICRLVSATHLAGERGNPVVDLSWSRPGSRAAT